MTDIRCIIVDDEKYARQVIKHHIDKTLGLILLAECKNGQEANKAIRELKPDIVFLDINMPLKGGLAVAKEVPEGTEVIFTTALKEHALESYELNALDYLLKPVTYERFLKSLSRYHKTGSNIKVQTGTQSEPSSSITIRAERKNHRVLLRDIVYVSGLKDYVKVVTQSGQLVPNLSMAYMNDKLSTASFIRVHRSYIVNLDYMAAYTNYDIELVDGTEIPIGQSYKDEVQNKLNTL